MVVDSCRAEIKEKMEKKKKKRNALLLSFSYVCQGSLHAVTAPHKACITSVLPVT